MLDQLPRSLARLLGAMRHLREMGANEVQQFLQMLANERRVSVSTHNLALIGLLFWYREVLKDRFVDRARLSA